MASEQERKWAKETLAKHWDAKMGGHIFNLADEDDRAAHARVEDIKDRMRAAHTHSLTARWIQFDQASSKSGADEAALNRTMRALMRQYPIREHCIDCFGIGDDCAKCICHQCKSPRAECGHST